MGRLTKDQIEDAVYEIREFLYDNDMFQGVTIYFNGKRIMSGWDYWMYVLKGDEAQEEISEEMYMEQECDVLDYIPEADDETLIAMTYEGEFYALMNTGSYPEEKEEFMEILKSHKLKMYPVDGCRMLLG